PGSERRRVLRGRLRVGAERPVTDDTVRGAVGQVDHGRVIDGDATGAQLLTAFARQLPHFLRCHRLRHLSGTGDGSDEFVDALHPPALVVDGDGHGDVARGFLHPVQRVVGEQGGGVTADEDAADPVFAYQRDGRGRVGRVHTDHEQLSSTLPGGKPLDHTCALTTGLLCGARLLRVLLVRGRRGRITVTRLVPTVATGCRSQQSDTRGRKHQSLHR